MTQSTNKLEQQKAWVVDYSAARAKAIEWLGDRYLLATPINRSSATSDFPAIAVAMRLK